MCVCLWVSVFAGKGGSFFLSRGPPCIQVESGHMTSFLFHFLCCRGLTTYNRNIFICVINTNTYTNGQVHNVLTLWLHMVHRQVIIAFGNTHRYSRQMTICAATYLNVHTQWCHVFDSEALLSSSDGHKTFC